VTKEKLMLRLVLAAVLALSFVPAAFAQAPQKVVFALNWFAVGDHAAYWVALDRGYYKSRGLEVELQNSKGSGDSIAKVDSGRADVGLADAVVVIPRVAQGAKIKVVGAVFDLTPLNIWTRKDTGITKPKDLEGKLLAAPAGDAQRQLFPAFAKLNGVDESKVKWLSIEPAAKFVALSEKRADAVPDYTTGQPFWEKAVGKDNLVRMPWHQYGFDTYSMSIMASEKTMKERPAMLKKFLEASYMGWRDVMADPKAAMVIYKKVVPEIDVGQIEANLLLGLELMKTERYAKSGIGFMDDKKMCASVDLVNTYMALPRKVECSAAFTNDFLAKIAMPAQ
jgi:NitT/TauT family transport system substrate-binding protein